MAVGNFPTPKFPRNCLANTSLMEDLRSGSTFQTQFWWSHNSTHKVVFGVWLQYAEPFICLRYCCLKYYLGSCRFGVPLNFPVRKGCFPQAGIRQAVLVRTTRGVMVPGRVGCGLGIITRKRFLIPSGVLMGVPRYRRREETNRRNRTNPVTDRKWGALDRHQAKHRLADWFNHADKPDQQRPLRPKTWQS